MAHTYLYCQLGWLRLGRAPARLRNDAASCGPPPGRLTCPTATAQPAAAATLSLNGRPVFLSSGSLENPVSAPRSYCPCNKSEIVSRVSTTLELSPYDHLPPHVHSRSPSLRSAQSVTPFSAVRHPVQLSPSFRPFRFTELRHVLLLDTNLSKPSTVAVRHPVQNSQTSKSGPFSKWSNFLMASPDCNRCT
eukprot:4443700-Prymnesium_polylepis.1